jgi:hypothetical protein
LMAGRFMIGHYFAISAMWSRSGISCPRSASRKRIAGSASASTTAALSLAITPFSERRYPQTYFGAGGMADE